MHINRTKFWSPFLGLTDLGRIVLPAVQYRACTYFWTQCTSPSPPSCRTSACSTCTCCARTSSETRRTSSWGSPSSRFRESSSGLSGLSRRSPSIFGCSNSRLVGSCSRPSRRVCAPASRTLGLSDVGRSSWRRRNRCSSSNCCPMLPFLSFRNYQKSCPTAPSLHSQSIWSGRNIRKSLRWSQSTTLSDGGPQ